MMAIYYKRVANPLPCLISVVIMIIIYVNRFLIMKTSPGRAVCWLGLHAKCDMYEIRELTEVAPLFRYLYCFDKHMFPQNF